MLPDGVRRVKRRGVSYFYWAPGRGTDRAVRPIPLGKDHTHPEFWATVRRLQAENGKSDKGSFRALITEYETSPTWNSLRKRTQGHYAHQLNKVRSAWGDLAVKSLTAASILQVRAKLERTPVAANHFVVVLRTLLAWGLEHGYGERNPANDIRPIEIKDEKNARPWPQWAYEFVIANAPEHLRRAAFLGRATGQRRSDLVLMGKKNRRDDGIAFKISKLRGKEHFVPLTAADIAVIDEWSCSDTGPWIVSPTGRAMSGDHLQSSLGRFAAKHPKLKAIGLKMHGLRAMAACDRKMLGFDNASIGKSIGMSTGMVDRYTKHIDQEALARKVRDGLERGANEIGKSPVGDWKTATRSPA